MFICEKCRYIYNVTKDIKNKQIGGKINIALDTIFEKFLSGEEILGADIKHISSKDILDDERYDRMNKKNQKKFVSIIKSINKNFFVEDEKDQEISDAHTDAYFICKFCKNSKLIEPKTIIYSRNYSSDTSLEVEDYKLMIHDYTLPRTRNYNCKNSKCPTHKNPDLKEAIITKNISERVIYVCTQCTTHWINTV